MMQKKKCAIISCKKSTGRMFSFPHPTGRPEVFWKWLRASDNPDLLKLSENKIRKRVICAKHFESRYFLAKKLSNTAVPTLFLSDSEEEIKVKELSDQKAVEVVNCSEAIKIEEEQCLIENLREGETVRCGTPSTTSNEERLNGKLHILQPDAKGKHRDCLVCSNYNVPGGRSTTLYFCETCNTKPFLHVGDCFKKYHTLKTYR